MHVYLKDHFAFLFESFFVGVLLSVTYDIFRIIRVARGVRYDRITSPEHIFSRYSFLRIYNEFSKKRCNKNNRGIRNTVFFFLEDIFYSLIITLTVLILVYGANYGIPRLFSFVGMLLGFFIYRITLGRFVILFSEYICYFAGAIIFYLFYPFIFLLIKTKKVIYKSLLIIYNKYEFERIRIRSKNKVSQLQKELHDCGMNI